MAKQSKLNKGLVAGLTMVGMLAVVFSVTALTIVSRQRDPKKFAERATAAEQRGDLIQAATFYRKAYNINKDVSYLKESARCVYQMGSLGDLFNILAEANSADPNDVSILTYALDRLWEMRQMGQRPGQMMRDYAEKLAKLDPNNVLALVSEADAIGQSAANDPASKKQADDAFKKAQALDPKSARVALMQVNRDFSEAIQKLRDAGETLTTAQQEAGVKAARMKSIETLKTALESHNDDPYLLTTLADAYNATQQYDQARKLLEDAVKRVDSVELRLAVTRFLVGEVDRQKKAGKTEELEALIRDAQQNAGRAIELDKAAFEAYALRIRLMQLDWERTGEWDKNKPELALKLLQAYQKALADTNDIHSARASLDLGGRANLVTQGFDLAMQLIQTATVDTQKADAIKAANSLAETCGRLYPDTYLFWMMKGQLAYLQRDYNAAVQAYVKVEEKTAPPDVAASAFGQTYSRIAKEQLSFLYRETGEPGLALKYADSAITAYQAQRADMPRRLVLNRGDLLVLLKRGQEALDMAERILRGQPDDTDFKRLRARALSLIPGREKDAQEAAATLEGEKASPDLKIDRIRIAAYQQDWDTAEKLIREVLADNPNNLEAARLLVQVLLAANKPDVLAQVLNEIEPRVTDTNLQRLVKAYKVSLATKDEAQRDIELLKIIDAIPEPLDRAQERFSFYFSRNKYDEASAALDEVEKLKPDDKGVLMQQFLMCLQRKQMPRAEGYSTKLAAMNADSAHGAVLRGQIKYAAGDFAAALAEFRTAEKDLKTDVDLKIKIATTLISSAEPHYDEALEVLKQALEYNPRSFPAQKLVCMIMDKLERSSEAIPNLKIAAELNPNDKYIREHRDILEDETEPKKGIERREKLRESKPNDVNNLTRLAQLYVNVGEREKAEATLKAAMAVEPPTLDLARIVARYYAAIQNRGPAEEYFKKLIAATDRVPRTQAMIIECHFLASLGNVSDAVELFKEAEKTAEAIGQADEKRAAQLMVAADEGQFFLDLKRYEESSDAFRRAMTFIRPEDTAAMQAARLKIMKNCLLTKKFAEAEPLIDAFIKDYPTEIRGLMARAELQLARGQLTDGRTTLSAVLKESPDQTWSLFMRGKVNADLKAYSDAVADLSKVKQLAPKGFNYLHRIELARVYQLTDKIDLAEAELRSILTDVGNDAGAVDIAMMLVQLFTSTNQEPKAQEFIGTMIAKQPQNPNWPYQLGRLFLNRKDYSNAEAQLRKAVVLSKGSAPQAQFDWITTMARGNRAAEAVAEFEKIEPSKLDPLLRTAGAEAYLAAQKAEPARNQLRIAMSEAAQRGIDALGSILERVHALVPTEQEAMVRALLNKGEGDSSVIARLRIALARTLIQTKDAAKLKEARNLLDEVQKVAPPRSGEMATVMMHRAQSYEASNELDQAVKEYEAAIQAFPSLGGALNNVAFLLSDKMNKPADAIPYAERARELMPDNGAVLDTLGWAYYMAGQADRAETALLDAVRLDPQLLAARYHLGQLQEKGGNSAGAKRQYQAGLETARSNGQADSDFAKKLQEALNRLGG